MNAEMRRAAHVLDLLTSGQFEEIPQLFVRHLRPLVSSSAIAAAWREAVGSDAASLITGTPTVGPFYPGVTSVRVPLQTPLDAGVLIVSMTEAGLLTGLEIVPGEAR